MLSVSLATGSNIKDVWNCQVFYKTISYSAKTKGIQTFLDYRKPFMGYFSRINILLMITVFKLQPQLFDYNYLHKCVNTYPGCCFDWLNFQTISPHWRRFLQNCSWAGGILPILAPSGTGEPTTTYGLLPLRGGSARKTTFFRLLYERPGGTPHMKGVGMLVGNFELKP